MLSPSCCGGFCRGVAVMFLPQRRQMHELRPASGTTRAVGEGEIEEEDAAGRRKSVKKTQRRRCVACLRSSWFARAVMVSSSCDASTEQPRPLPDLDAAAWLHITLPARSGGAQWHARPSRICALVSKSPKSLFCHRHTSAIDHAGFFRAHADFLMRDLQLAIRDLCRKQTALSQSDSR